MKSSRPASLVAQRCATLDFQRIGMGGQNNAHRPQTQG